MTESTRTLADLPCVPESRLPAELLARLPASTSPPPWHCRVRAVLWFQRATAPLPTGSPYARRVLPVTVGAVVDYLETPVGPYREVFAGPLLRRLGRPTAHIPFMAVDALASVHGGRAHWQLPKTMASFSGDIAAEQALVTGEGWSVQVSAAPYGPRLPLVAPFGSAQGGRTAAVDLHARGRLARVQVAARGPTLSGWLGSGSHAGIVAEGRMVVHPAVAE
jgi:hypothetical protein